MTLLAGMLRTCDGNGHFLLYPVRAIPVVVIPGGVIQCQGQIQAQVTAGQWGDHGRQLSKPNQLKPDLKPEQFKSCISYEP